MLSVKDLRPARRFLWPLLAGLAACSSSGADAVDKATPAAPAGDPHADFVTWTQDGKVYHADNVAAYTYQGMKSAAINGAVVPEGQALSERTVTLTIPNDQLKPGTYSLAKTQTPSTIAAGSLLLAVKDATPRGFSTMAGPAATNGTLTLTECDPKTGHLTGTFQFTAQAFEKDAPATQAVTAGSFRITKLLAAPDGM